MERQYYVRTGERLSMGSRRMSEERPSCRPGGNYHDGK
jgi:hypothetical protein